MMRVGLSKWKLVAGVEPKLTPVALSNSAPVIVTVVPPAMGPAAGLMAVIDGAGM